MDGPVSLVHRWRFLGMFTAWGIRVSLNLPRKSPITALLGGAALGPPVTRQGKENLKF